MLRVKKKQLQSKLHLDELDLQWTKNDAFSDSEEEVLEHLQPNSTLKRLTICGYSGARSPSWLEAESLSKLESLILKDCKRWVDFPFIRQELFGSTESNRFYREWFPCLSVLEIYNCPLLQKLPLLPPSLRTLILEQVGLTEFPGIQGVGGSSTNIATVSPLLIRIRCRNLTSLDGIECFPCLKYLYIKDCPLLTRLPPLPPSLVELKLIQVGLTELQGGSSSNISTISLSVLKIGKCASLTNVGRMECCPCLSVVWIVDCPLLTKLPLFPPSLVELELFQVGLIELPGIGRSSSNIATVSLSRLHIQECSNMISLEQGLLSNNLPNLEHIFVKDCGELLRMPIKKFKEFTNLKYLYIDNCPKLMSMAHDDDIHLLLPPSMRLLELSNSGKVGRSLPGCLYNLTSLGELNLCDCTHFISLPREPLLHLERLALLYLLNCNELRSIEGLGVLKSLKKLKIYGCPMLQLNEGDGQGESIVSLVELDVDNTALLKVLPLRYILPSIKALIIEYSLELNMFEREDQELLRSLTSLKYLKFHDCKNLRSLPAELHTLHSLELLEVYQCTQIRSLPEKGLPIALTDLHFYHCHPTLENQLKEHLAEMEISGRFHETDPSDFMYSVRIIRKSRWPVQI